MKISYRNKDCNSSMSTAAIDKSAKSIEAGGGKLVEEVTNLNEAPVQTQIFWLVVWMANNVLGTHSSRNSHATH